MSAHRGLSTYRQTQVQSRTPLELVVMLYDGALKFLYLTRDAIERRDLHARREASSRALAIVSELQSTLNMTEGGDIAARLDELYAFANRCIIDATADNAVAPLDDAIRVLDTLRESWVSVATAPADVLRGAA